MSRASMMITMFALLCPSMLAADCQNQPEGCIDQPQDEVKMLQVREAEVVGPPDVTKYVEPAAVTTARATATWQVNNAETARLETIADAKMKIVNAKIAKIAANSAAATKQNYANKAAKATAQSEAARKKNNQALGAKTAADTVNTMAAAAKLVAATSNTTASTNAAYSATQAATVAAAVTAQQALADTAKVNMQNTVNTKKYGQSVAVATSANVNSTAAAQSALVSRVLSDYDAFLKKQKNTDASAQNVVLKDASKNQSNAVSINMKANKAAAHAAQQATKLSKLAAPIVTCATPFALGFQADLSATTAAQLCVAVGAGFPGVAAKADQANSPCPTGVCRFQDCCDELWCNLPAIDIALGSVTGFTETAGSSDANAAAIAANNAACLQSGNARVPVGIKCTVTASCRDNAATFNSADTAHCLAAEPLALIMGTPDAMYKAACESAVLSTAPASCTYAAGGTCVGGAGTGACLDTGAFATLQPSCTPR